MATAQSVSFQADKDTLFATTIQIIQGAGYIISETNDAARKIVYFADLDQGFMSSKYRFEVTITVSGASQTATPTALFNMKAVCIDDVLEKAGPLGQFAQNKANSRFEGELISFCINELRKQYQVVATATTNANAPGAGGQKGGCLVLLGFLGLLAAGSGFGCLTLWANLFQ